MTSGLGGRAQLAGSRGGGSGGSRTPPPHRRKHPRERPGACLCPGLQGQLEPGSEPGARSGGAQEDPFRQTLPACRGARAFNPCLGRPGSQLCAVVPLVGRLSRSATLLPGGSAELARLGPGLQARAGRTQAEAEEASVRFSSLSTGMHCAPTLERKGARSRWSLPPEPPPPPPQQSWGEWAKGRPKCARPDFEKSEDVEGQACSSSP